jgi:hypothetical protein
MVGMLAVTVVDFKFCAALPKAPAGIKKPVGNLAGAPEAALEGEDGTLTHPCSRTTNATKKVITLRGFISKYLLNTVFFHVVFK